MRAVFCILLAMGVVGCGRTQPETLVPVTGIVEVEGQALKLGWVTFYPDEDGGNSQLSTPLAEIKNDGRYDLATNGKRGAPPGKYKVVVAATREPLPARPPPPREGKPWSPAWLHHEKYARPQTTDLRIEVVAQSSPGHYDLRLRK
jgi:hypothetical protein